MKGLEQKLIHSRPETSLANEGFVKDTIRASKQAQSRETFAQLTRTKGVNKQKEHFMTKLLALPKFALVAIGAGVVVASTGVAYAALNWFDTSTDSKQQKNGVHLTTVNCSPSTVQALQSDQKQTNVTEYKILKPALITETDFEQDELASCEQRAIEDGVRKKSPDIYMPGDAHGGLYYPIGKYGTVTAVNGMEITVANIPVDHQQGPRELTTATLAISQETLVTDRGRAVTAASFKPGDPVYFVFQNGVRGQQNDNDWRHTPSSSSTVRALAKTQYDHRAIKEKMYHAASKNAFLILKKSDGFGG